MLVPSFPTHSGGSILTSVSNIAPETLGKCEALVEKQVGAERFVHVFVGVGFILVVLVSLLCCACV